MRKIMTAALALILVMAAGCYREPIVYPVSNYYLAVTMHRTPGYEYEEEEPAEILSVNVYDHNTGKLVLHTYIRPKYHPVGMPEGGYIDGLQPGDYDFLVYNFDTNPTEVHSEERLGKVYADTDVYGYSSLTPVIKAPDHLFTANIHEDVPYISAEDGVYYINADLSTVVEEWRVRVGGIKDLDKAESITVYVSGQCRGRMLGPDGDRIYERSIVMFQGRKAPNGADVVPQGEEYVIYTPYTTFGRMPGMRYLMTVAVTGPDGSQYMLQEDVTDIIEEHQDTDRTIDLEWDVTIEGRKQGGFNPTSEPWDPEVHTIEIS